MNHIITFAVIVFVIICAFILAKGTSFSAFLSDSVSFIKRLFCKKAKINNNPKNTQSQGTIGLSGRLQGGKSAISLAGSPAKEGIQVQISAFDHSGNLIGTKTVYADDDPVLIGRGTESMGFKSKLCLPDISDEPTTSRTHCILVNNAGSLVLKDCYDREEAFDDCNNQIHSVSKDYRTNKYIGNGFVIDSGGKAEVDIGDYILKIKNLTRLSSPNVPTYGHKAVSSSPTKIAGVYSPSEVRTKESEFGK